MIHDEVCHIKKTVRLEAQNQTTRPDILNLIFQYKPSDRRICFNTALDTLKHQAFPIQNTQIFFWDSVRSIFVYIGCYPSQRPIEAPYQFFQQNLIHLKYRKITKKTQIHPQRETTSHRRKERLIIDAYQKVSLWMKIYEQLDANGKRIHTLQEAAKQVGVSKKTLDDYKNQIRLGENFQFDFSKNRYEKIGILRNFVKQKMMDHKASIPSKRQIFVQAQPTSSKQAASYSKNNFGSQDRGYLFHQTDSYCDSD